MNCKAIEKNILAAIRRMKRNGTTGASFDCLCQNTPTTGVNVPVAQYRAIFDETAQRVAKAVKFSLYR